MQFTGIPASLTFRKVSFLLCVCIMLIIYWKGFRFHFYHYFRFQILYRVFKRKLTADIPAERIRIKIRFLIMLFGYLCYQCAWILWLYYKRYLLGEMKHSDKLETAKKLNLLQNWNFHENSKFHKSVNLRENVSSQENANPKLSESSLCGGNPWIHKTSLVIFWRLESN